MSDMFRLDGKTALITGASRGIGRAIAMAFAEQGARVLLTARNMELLKEVRAQVRELGVSCECFAADLSDMKEVERLIGWAGEQGPIDCYVNNAAFTAYKKPTETSPETMAALFHTNYRASIMLAQAVAAQMREHEIPGSIVFITSINALSPLPGQAAYSSTKAALESMMKSLASELAPFGVRVNSVAPGAVLTDMNPHFTPEKIAEFSPKIPLGRIGDPEDIGGAAVFLCSPAAGYITGSTIVVDGGYLLRR